MIPGRKYRVLRRLAQAVGVLVLLVAPFMGGWQRLDRNNLASWDPHGWDLPPALLEMLPLGEMPTKIYEANEALGGGAVFSVGGVAAVDPLVGLVALSRGVPSWLLLIAWLLPMLLALFAGRAFCGWICPFGTLSRLTERLLNWLPWRPRPLRLPDRRPVRWVVLVLTVGLAVTVTQVALYMALPHVLMQQVAYGMWLMGGLGAAAGWLAALLVVGLLFGPTAWCASVCPTGAALSVPGRLRVFKIYLEDAARCGKGCDLCIRSCWQQLDPGSGDPGPDCDLCARCVPTCPTTNLRIGRAPKITGLLLLLAALSPALAPTPAYADAQMQPKLLMDVPLHRGELEARASIIDRTKLRLDADDPRTLTGAEVTVFIVRGPLQGPSRFGKIPFRDVYRGPLALRIEAADGTVRFKKTFEKPTAPMSTPRRRLYRVIVPQVPLPGERLVVSPIEGWTTEALSWSIPTHTPASTRSFLTFFLGGLLVLGALLAFAFAAGAAPGRPNRKARTE